MVQISPPQGKNMLSMVPLKKHTRQNRILMSHSHHPGNINTANYNNLFSDFKKEPLGIHKL